MECDIVLLTWNHLECTKPCVESILKYTHIPSRLIIVDNGSDDLKAKEYLRHLQGNEKVEIVVLYNNVDEGYSKGTNKGMRHSTAPYLCLLNNDTLMTEGWLEEMLDIFYKNSDIGILNPSSNTFNRYPDKGETLESYVKRLKSHQGKWIETSSCVGFCMLIRREVVEKIGFLDESFGMAYAEDRDYSMKAQAAGYKCAIARAAYVYHIGDKSFCELPDRDELFKRNTEIFWKRWGKSLRIAYLVGNSIKERVKEESIKEISFAIARDNHQAWLFLKKSLGPLSDMIEHSNIRYFWIADTFYRLTCIYKILKRKRKKKIDIILTEDRILNNILKGLKFYHEADVVFEPRLERVRELCKEKSRYP